MKRPAFQFYPADWCKDSALQSCSIAARGLWIEMLCIMHECEPYGHLSINGHGMNTAQLARLVGESEKAVKGLLDELESAGVFSRTEAGCIYSRRMVHDEHIRAVRSASGQLGGHPDLLKQKRSKAENWLKQQSSKTAADDPANIEQTLKQKPTPSSSSSMLSIPGGMERECARRAPALATRLPPDWVLPEAWRAWAQQERPDWPPTQVQRVAEQFRDYWLAKAGADACKVDWQAAWRNWVRREQSLSGAANGKTSGPGVNQQAALEAHNAQVGAQWLAEMEAKDAQA